MKGIVQVGMNDIVQVVINYMVIYHNIQCFTMAMPFNMTCILYLIPCKLSCDFSKLPSCIYMYIYSIIVMTNKSEMTCIYVNKYLSKSIYELKLEIASAIPTSNE